MNSIDSWKNSNSSVVDKSNDSLTKILLSAKDNDEYIDIIYHGGSTPGQERKILPLKIYKKENFDTRLYLEAYCLKSKENRNFRLDKIQIGNIKLKNISTSTNRQDINKFAKRHIDEAKQFSEEIGGTDQDVKDYFFSLNKNDLEVIFTEYGNKYGSEKEDYARNTFERWRRGQRIMSGLVANRIFSIIPAHMPLEMKYKLAENLWIHFGPQSVKKYQVGIDTDIQSIIETITSDLDEVIINYNLPDNLKKRFEWLSSNDIDIKQKLLNFFRQETKKLAIQKASLEIPIFQEKFKSNPLEMKHAKIVLDINKISIAIIITPLENSISRLSLVSEASVDEIKTDNSFNFGMIFVFLLIVIIMGAIIFNLN